MKLGKGRRRYRARHAARRAAPRGTLLALVSHTVRMQIRGALIWGAALGLYGAAIVASFTTFEDTQALNDMLQAYPEGMLEAFGITDLSTIEGYLASQVFVLAPLALAFFPILASAGAIAGAEERGTIDVLLGNPIRRWHLVVGSFVATSVSLLFIVAVFGVLTWGTAVLVDVDLASQKTAEAVANLWPICLFFGSLALLCSAILRRRALAIAIPGVVLFGMYLVDAIGRASEDLENLRPASVFYYYGSAIENGIDWQDFGGTMLVALLFVLLAILVFRRRDIYT